jgi:excisionase family DNA binding protein
MFESVNAYAEQLRREHGSALLNKKQAAKELGVSRATLDRFRQQGLISTKKVGHQVRIPVTEVARIVMESKVEV